MLIANVPAAFLYSLNLFLELGTALLTGPVANGPTTSAMRLLVQKMFWLRMKLLKSFE